MSLLTSPRWEQGGKRRAPSSLQKELSEKPPRNVYRRVPAAKGHKPRSASVESSENFVCERTLLLVCSSAKQFSK